MNHKRFRDMPRHRIFLKHLNIQLSANHRFQSQLNRVATDVVRTTNIAIRNEAFRIAQPFERQ